MKTKGIYLVIFEENRKMTAGVVNLDYQKIKSLTTEKIYLTDEVKWLQFSVLASVLHDEKETFNDVIFDTDKVMFKTFFARFLEHFEKLKLSLKVVSSKKEHYNLLKSRPKYFPLFGREDFLKYARESKLFQVELDKERNY